MLGFEHLLFPSPAKPIIRCSELEQVLSCPGSIVLKRLVRSRAGSEGFEGTVLHYRIAAQLMAELGASSGNATGLIPPNVPAGFKLSKGSEWIIRYCVALVRHAAPPGDSLEVEAPFAYSFDRWTLSGHLDVSCIDQEATRAAGWDWKTGRKPVSPAVCNSQALGYIVLQKRAWPTLQQAEFSIVQPLNNEDEGDERITTTQVEGAKLDACVKYLDEQVCDALDRSGEVISGLAQCDWCPVGIQCPAIQAEIEAMKINLTPEMLAKITKEPNDALLGDMVIAARTIWRAVDDAERLLHARLDKVPQITSGAGVQITRTVMGGRYTVLDPVAFYAGLKTIADEDKIAAVLSYPVTRIKDLIAEEMDIPKTGKAELTAESVFQGKFGPLVEQTKRRQLIFK